MCRECKRITNAALYARKRDEYKQRYQDNREEVLARVKKYQDENPDKVKARNLKRYGITLEDFNRMKKAQGNVCAICGGKEDKKELSVDHCHKTGKVRGLLCAGCNYGLGFLADDTALIRRALAYLENSIKENTHGD